MLLVFLVILALTLTLCGALLGSKHIPGVLGEWIGMMAGVMTTPFFMEASFILIGLSIVVWINHHRQKRAGDDFVEFEVKDSEQPPKP